MKTKKWKLIFGLGLLALVLLSIIAVYAMKKQENDFDHPVEHMTLSVNEYTKKINELRKQMQGKIVYHRHYRQREGTRDVYIKEIGDVKATLVVTNAAHPRWSPDGKAITFVRGTDVMWVRDDGTGLRKLAASEGRVIVEYHPNGKEVYYINNKKINSVHLETGEIRTVLKGRKFMELGISQDGKRVVCTIKSIGYDVYGFDLQTGKSWKVGKGCSAGISPDGEWVSNNQHGHLELWVRQFSDGKKLMVVTPPPNKQFDQQSWSNKKQWILSVIEGARNDIFVHHVQSNTYTRVTQEGDCDYPDLYVY